MGERSWRSAPVFPLKAASSLPHRGVLAWRPAHKQDQKQGLGTTPIKMLLHLLSAALSSARALTLKLPQSLLTSVLLHLKATIQLLTDVA